ncbi:cob(I)yrinic acid a,c-diamide adenosyltransferase [Granulicoccus sp. GXG6511]|uniref:cob(I)yrinic acid a,c-diamide adenosyltransferase n=1 Tax=Granulicoccus sp. GXG6511 TaxID=3381351 RepID=UPI003D7E1AF4
MVVLSRIYTRTGDGGDTRLSDMSLARKTDPRVAAYGDVDETNSAIGVALAHRTAMPAAICAALDRVQNELFDVGADLSNPLAVNPAHPPLRITAEAVDRLEAWCDEFGEDLPTLRSFILPGGTPAGAALHLARTICRRAERSAWVAVETYGTEPAGDETAGGINEVAVRYLNRLSDLLFICARAVNGAEGEVLWVPGGDRDQDADESNSNDVSDQ